MLWELLGQHKAPEPDWWLDSYVRVASQLETGAAYQPRGGHFTGYSGPMWRYVRERVSDAYRRDLSGARRLQ